MQPAVRATLADARTPVLHEASFRLITDMVDHLRHAPLRDLSAGGAALLTDQAIEPGKVLVVFLHGLVPPKLARVRYAIGTGRGQWSVGCSFADRLSDEELHTILDAK
jgi:hypothetical protein